MQVSYRQGKDKFEDNILNNFQRWSMHKDKATSKQYIVYVVNIKHPIHVIDAKTDTKRKLKVMEILFYAMMNMKLLH